VPIVRLVLVIREYDDGTQYRRVLLLCEVDTARLNRYARENRH
jgi:hypothetical protein